MDKVIRSLTPLIQVVDMPRSLAFYRDVLGFTVVSDSGEGDNSSWVWLQLNGLDLMLNDQYEPGNVPPVPPIERVRWHSDTCIYLSCPDVDAVYEYLVSKGIAADPPKVAPYGMKQLYLTDPDNYGICFQWPAGERMNGEDLRSLWSETLRKDEPTVDAFEQLAAAVVEVHNSDLRFREHIKNRFNSVTESTGHSLNPECFDVEMARAFIADEIGFGSWDDLITSIREHRHDDYPLLFKYAIAALRRGDFTALELAVGGPDAFDKQLKEWLAAGYLDREPETMAESFAAACMLGHKDAAAALLDAGVDPYAGMSTGLAGFHYAASSGRLNVIKLLIDRDVPLEVKNMYGGTVFGQAIWSAVNEYKPDHAEIVERLVEAGAVVDNCYKEWWKKQSVPDEPTKIRIANVLKRHGEFQERSLTAKKQADDAERSGDKRALADALKSLGNILRRPRFSRVAANAAYTRSAKLYAELGLPLEAAWVKRHIGINYEYAERLEDAERYYDEALALFREHADNDDRNYANTVRYPAVIKNRLEKREESTSLWEETVMRYGEMNEPLGIAEGAAWLTIFALERSDLEDAHRWFGQAEAAARAANDRDTFTFVREVETKLRQAEAP